MPTQLQYSEPVTRAVTADADYAVVIDTDYQRGDDTRPTFEAVISAQNLGERIDRMDVTSRYQSNPIVLFNHDRNKPIGNAVSVKQERDTGAWVSEFQFAEGDPDADRVKNLWQQGTVRATSIGFSTRKGVPILHEFSIVPIGLDEKALARDDLEDSNMDEERNEEPQDDKPVQTRVVGDLKEGAAVQNRNDDEVPGIEIVGSSADEHPEEFNEQIASIVEERVALELRNARIVQRAAPLLPDNYAGTEPLEVLRTAVGTGVSDLESRSLDYLEGRLDVTLEKRAAAEAALASASTNRVDSMNPALHARSVQDIMKLTKEMRNGNSD